MGNTKRINTRLSS